MNKRKEIETKMEFLIDMINKWNNEYYVLNNPSVSDSVYDQNYNLLKEMEKETKIILKNSPTLKIGSSLEKKTNSFLEHSTKIIKRKKPMISIENVNNFSDLRKFDQRVKKYSKKNINYVCELKIDGISVSVIYEKGQVKQLSTRGDGFFGEEVTENKFLISDLPLNLPFQENCEVRGEVYMNLKEFNLINESLNKKGLKILSNARNAAAGSLRSLASKVDIKERKLNFFSYQFLPSEKFAKQEECLEFLKKNNFQVSDYEVCSDIQSVENFIERIEKTRKNIGFLIDGVVVKVNEYEICSKLGETNKFPRWSIAYKFVSSDFSTTIEDIKSSVGKNGRISYVALVVPFYLEGSLIKKVTLHNYSFIKNNLVNISDEILVKKSGDVIPQVSKVLKKNQSGPWIPKDFCPSCSSKIIWNDNGIYQICVNDFCHEKIINYLCFCVSKSALNIKGVSKSTIEKIYNKGILKNQSDFYQLWKKKDVLTEIFREKTLENIISSVSRSRKQELSKVISSFSIPLLSTYKAMIVSNFFSNDIKKFSEKINCFEQNDFSDLRKNLGEKTFKSFESFFANEKNSIELQKLSNEISTKG